MPGHRAALWSVAAAHLAVAALTVYGGVPIASTAVLALVGVAAAVLAVAGPPGRSERRRPLRRDRHRLGRLQTRGWSSDDGAGGPESTGH